MTSIESQQFLFIFFFGFLISRDFTVHQLWLRSEFPLENRRKIIEERCDKMFLMMMNIDDIGDIQFTW